MIFLALQPDTIAGIAASIIVILFFIYLGNKLTKSFPVVKDEEDDTESFYHK